MSCVSCWLLLHCWLTGKEPHLWLDFYFSEATLRVLITHHPWSHKDPLELFCGCFSEPSLSAPRGSSQAQAHLHPRDSACHHWPPSLELATFLYHLCLLSLTKYATGLAAWQGLLSMRLHTLVSHTCFTSDLWPQALTQSVNLNSHSSKYQKISTFSTKVCYELSFSLLS